MIDVLTVLSPGLLGASVARAAAERLAARQVRVWARRPEVRLQAAREPWCAGAPATVEEAAAGAGLVVICAPVEAIPELAGRAAGAVPAPALVTDVGSVKGEVCRLAAHAAAGRAVFVGSHPMAGSEKAGWEHADARLFEGRPCFVTPFDDTPPAAAEAVARFWDALGAVVTTMHPDRHDEVVAHLSHLPHAAAAALAAFLHGTEPAWRDLGGPGLRDTTRVAAGDPALWVGILEANREEVLRALRGYQDKLEELQAALANRDRALLRHLLAAGRSFRQSLP